MPQSSFNHPLFGKVVFRTMSRTWQRGDKIQFISGFDAAEITPLIVPQLIGVPGTPNGELPFHRRAHGQLLSAFAEIEKLGLLHHVKTCAGSVSVRLRLPTSGALSKLPSDHAFGIAIDLNEADPGFGDSVAPVAPIFQNYGFTWGKAFNDPMHFEINRFL